MSVPWTWYPSSINTTITQITGDSTGQYIVCCGYNVNGTGSGVIFFSTNYGFSWNGPIYPDVNNKILALACSADGSIMYAVTNGYANIGGSGGGLYKSTTYGASWTLVNTPENYLSGVCCDSLGKNVVITTDKSNGGLGNTWYCADPTITSPSWTVGNYTEQNWTSVAVNSDASLYFALASDNSSSNVFPTGVYFSTDGTIWEIDESMPFNIRQTWTCVTFSRDDSTVILCSKGIGSTSNGNIYINKTPSVLSSWEQMDVNYNYSFLNVALSADGNKVYACVAAAQDFGLYYGTYAINTTIMTLDTSSQLLGNTFCVYINPITGIPLAIGSAGAISSGLHTTQPGAPTPICFKEGSQILCLVDGVEQYIPIETMRPGTLVKTALDGYKPVAVIGFSKVYNPGNGTKSMHHLVKCTPAKYPELTTDLVLTGAHAVLVDDISDKQRADLQELMGDIYVTNKKYRLMACLDDRSESYDVEGLFTIWHFALEHEKYTWNYGVYANGLLVETTSLRMIKEFSGMTLL